MAKHLDIVAYWAKRIPETELTVDWADACERCWRCGYKCALDRCHIVPRSLGGLDEPSNLVLLCARCHRDAPNAADPNFMWMWLRAEAFPFYDSFWTDRGFKEYEKIFGRRAFSGMTDPNLTARIGEALRTQLNKTTIHFGEGRLNPSTIAWVIASVEQMIAAEHLPSAEQQL